MDDLTPEVEQLLCDLRNALDSQATLRQALR
jgi:hypothetical protein